MFKKIKHFFKTTQKKISDFIHKPSRKELLQDIQNLKAILRMYEESRNFVETHQLNRYSFNVAFSKYYRRSPYYEDEIKCSLANKIAEFIEENQLYQTYDGHKTNGRFLPEDEVKIYHCELWFEKKGEPIAEDYFKAQHSGNEGFNLRCDGGNFREKIFNVNCR